MTRTLLLLASLVASPHDAPMAEALEGTYGGSVDGALLSLEALSAAYPGDPVGPYLEALVFSWKIESQPESVLLDQECVRRADAAIALAQARLAKDSQDARALLAMGAAHGVKSRLALLRGDHGKAASEAVAMRSALLKARAADPDSKDVLFGLGLYDYFVDVLPRLAKVLRFLTGMPGGNRARGPHRSRRRGRVPSSIAPRRSLSSPRSTRSTREPRMRHSASSGSCGSAIPARLSGGCALPHSRASPSASTRRRSA